MNASRAPYPPRPHANRETFRRGSAHRPEAGSPAGSRGLSAGLGGRRSGHSCSGISGCPRANSARSGRAGCPQDWPAGDSGHGRSGASSSPTANRLTSLARSRELPRGWMVGAAAMAARTAAAYGANSVRSARPQCPQDWVVGDSGQGRLGGSSSSRGELTDQPGLLARTAEGRMVGAAATVARTAAGLRGANSVRSARAEWPQDWVGSVRRSRSPEGQQAVRGRTARPARARTSAGPSDRRSDRGRPDGRGFTGGEQRPVRLRRLSGGLGSRCSGDGCSGGGGLSGSEQRPVRSCAGCPGLDGGRSGRDCLESSGCWGEQPEQSWELSAGVAGRCSGHGRLDGSRLYRANDPVRS